MIELYRYDSRVDTGKAGSRWQGRRHDGGLDGASMAPRWRLDGSSHDIAGAQASAPDSTMMHEVASAVC